MVALTEVQQSNATSFGSTPLVAVFVGATAGIGEYTARALASLRTDEGRDLRVYIVGRNTGAANNIIAGCTKVCPYGHFTFVKATDLALLKDVDRVCSEIISLERDITSVPKIDLLIMTQGHVQFGGRKETPEGLDRSMSLLYYSRIRFIIKLMPLLLATSLPAAHVVSVYAAGFEVAFFADDLSLRDHYSFANGRSHSVYFKTIAFEHLAKEYAGRLSLVHTHPGLVVTPAYDDSSMPWWFRWTWSIAGPVVRGFVAFSSEESGARTLFLATPRFAARDDSQAASSGASKGWDGVTGSGAYAVSRYGESYDRSSVYTQLRKDSMPEKMWDHTMRAFEEIENGRTFKD